MTKHLLLAMATAVLMTGYSVTSPSPAHASWAESPQGNAVYTGMDHSLRRSERAVRGRAHRTPGYSAYGSYYGDVPAHGAYRDYAPRGSYFGGYNRGFDRY